MTAPSKAWVVIADSQVDADSPLDTTLVTGMRDDLVHLQEWLGYGKTPAQAHRHNGTDSERVTMADVSKTGAVGVFDDFNGCRADLTNGFLYSDIVWQINNTSAGVTVVTGDNGVVRISGTAAATRFGIQNLQNKPFKISGGNTLTFECKVKIGSAVANYFYFGLMNADDLTGDGAIFAAEGTSAIRAKNAFGGAVTNTDTGLTWAANTTYKLKIVITASQILFYVDDVLKVTHTTNIPTAAMAVCLFIRGSVADCDIDYVDCTSSARV